MDIIIHCKGIIWDTDGEDAKKLKLPSAFDFTMPLENICVTDGENLEEAIISNVNENSADYLSDKFGYCVASIKSATWEYDPKSCLKIVKRDAAKVLKAWKRERAKLYAVISDPKLTSKLIASHQKSYEAWLKKNLTKRGYIGTIRFNKPDDIIANLAK